MDDDKINQFMATVTEQMIVLERTSIQIKASVNALKFVLADEVNPDHPEQALAFFRQIEQKILDADPHAQEHKEVAEIMEAVKLWQKHGKHEA